MTDGFATGDGMADGALAIGDDGFAEAVMESDGALGEKARGGNGAWIRGEVAEASAILAARNLAHADAVAGPAHPKSGTLYLRFGKRALDVALSGIALLLTLPVNLVLAVLTYRDVGSPIFYVQERTGKDLKSFKMVKFRNMTEERDEDGELLPPEDRITKIGLFVRSHSMAPVIIGTPGDGEPTKSLSHPENSSLDLQKCERRPGTSLGARHHYTNFQFLSFAVFGGPEGASGRPLCACVQAPFAAVGTVA